MPEHAVIIHLPLRPEYADLSAYHALENKLTAAVESLEGGEFDGNEFGEGECIFYSYGTDADKLFACLEPHLRSTACAAGGHALKRYGSVFEPDVTQVRVEW